VSSSILETRTETWLPKDDGEIEREWIHDLVSYYGGQSES